MENHEFQQAVLTQLQAINTRLDRIETDITSIKADVKRLDAKIDTLSSGVGEAMARMADNVDGRLIKLTVVK